MRRKLLVLAVVLVLAIAVVLALGWAGAVSVPDWYEVDGGMPRGSVPSTPGSPDRGAGRGEGPDSGSIPAPGEHPGAMPAPATAATMTELLLRDLAIRGAVEVDEEQLRDVVVDSLAAAPDGRPFLAAARSVRARIGDREIEIGGLVDLSRVDLEALSPQARDAVASIHRYAPFLARGERYVGLRGEPLALDGDIALGEGATLRIGDLGLPLSLLASFSGQSTSAASSRLEIEGFHVTRAQVVGDRLVVEARPAPGR